MAFSVKTCEILKNLLLFQNYVASIPGKERSLSVSASISARKYADGFAPKSAFYCKIYRYALLCPTILLHIMDKLEEIEMIT